MRYQHGVDHDRAWHWRRQLVWGVLFIIAGTAILLDRVGVLDLDIDLAHAWHYWPWLLVVFGIINLIPPTNALMLRRGFGNIFFAAWWYVSFEHVWGLGFADTWPALLVACGIGMVMQPLLNRLLNPSRESSHVQ